MFKLSLRTLWRKKSFSLLNILGLAVGIAASLLIFLVIRHELSYDMYQSKRDRIFRVTTTVFSRSNGEVSWTHSLAPLPLASTMRQDFPALEKVAAMEEIGGQVYVPGKDLADEKRFRERRGVFFVEPEVFDILDFYWLEGNAAGLKEPNTVVLAQSVADAYFGRYTNAIGKTIQLWSYRIPLRVIGVFKDLPDNTDFQVRIGASYATYLNRPGNLQRSRDDWRSLSGGSQCLVMLRKNAGDVQRLQAQLPAFEKKYFQEDRDNTAYRSSLSFQPLKEVHLDKRFGTVKGDSLSTRELWSLGIIGAFLVLVACINFINLATVQSVTRAKEIGVRKVLGSNRAQLLKQFLSETAIITLIALILGCILAWFAIPDLSSLMEKTLTLDLLHHRAVLLFLVITGIAVTLLAGVYPGVVLSGFNPVAAIKSKISSRAAGGISLRRGLVVFQFVIAQLLVIGTLVVIKQMQFFRNQEMGFEKDAVVLLDLPSDSTLKVRYSHLQTRLSRLPAVVATSLCSTEPSSTSGQYSDFYFNNEPERRSYSVKKIHADTGYYNTFRMELVAGRRLYTGDTMREVLVNETLVKKLGLRSAEDILGKTISFDGTVRLPVVGVLRDFYNNPLRDPIHPLVMSPNFNDYGTLALRLHPDRMSATLKEVQKIFTEVYPTYLYECTFLDERIGNFYKAEEMTAQLFKIFAFLAILISCLGLYGLVSFLTVQKTREVGIRKVLGASVRNILYLFSKEFTILIGIAFLIAAPLGYYFMQKWLAGFHYHTEIGVGIFILAIVLSILVAWMAVGYKALKAALANPVKSLRSE